MTTHWVVENSIINYCYSDTSNTSRHVPDVPSCLCHLTVTRRVSHVVFSGVRVARYLAIYVMFCRSLFVLFRLAIMLSVHRFTTSDHPFGIFKLFIIWESGMHHFYLIFIPGRVSIFAVRMAISATSESISR